MTDRSESTRAARAGGRPLARAAVLALLTLLGPAALAQPVTWERLPLVPPEVISQQVPALAFLRGEGPDAADPDADSLVIFHTQAVFLYNPSGASGAAGSNGGTDPWHRLSNRSSADGVVTAAGSLVHGGPNNIVRWSADRGRTWAFASEEFRPYPLFESALPALAGPDGAPALFAGIGDAGETARSLDDGAPGSWVQVGSGFGYPQAFGEVPPSPALPDGRLLYGVWNGALYSDDGGLTYQPSNAFGQAAYIAWSFAFAPQAGHPYGGVAYAGLENLAVYPAPSAEVHRSDDGGATWVLAHRFTADETGQPEEAGSNVARVALLATPDGALWSGVSLQNGAGGQPRWGGIMRSVDGGTTWSRADAGYAGPEGRGYRVFQLRLSRTGVLYAATERGVWRTTTAVVTAEAGPVEGPGGVGVSVRPNPAGGRVEVAVSLASPGPVRVVVLDALGREIAVVLAGEGSGERVVGLDTSGWPAGVYVVRAEASGRVVSARLVVAR